METYQLILILIVAITIGILSFLAGKWTGALLTTMRWEKMVPQIRENATKQSRAVLTGQISEHLAPFLPGFPYKPSEARFIGKPIDFIIFEGMDEHNITKIIFVEVKSANSHLNMRQQSVRKAIEQKNVEFVEYRIPQ